MSGPTLDWITSLTYNNACQWFRFFWKPSRERVESVDTVEPCTNKENLEETFEFRGSDIMHICDRQWSGGTRSLKDATGGGVLDEPASAGGGANET